jgi:hypothetical protein
MEFLLFFPYVSLQYVEFQVQIVSPYILGMSGPGTLEVHWYSHIKLSWVVIRCEFLVFARSEGSLERQPRSTLGPCCNTALGANG